MKKYQIISVVSDPKKSCFYEGEIRGTYSTEEEARKHFPSIDEIKFTMRKELEQGARYSDTTSFGYTLEAENDDDEYGIPEELDSHFVSFAEVK